MTNPVWNAAVVSSIVSAAITLLVAFGVPVTEAQSAAILGFVGVVTPVLMAWWASSRVTPLAEPRDTDGTPLTRPDNAPANKELEKLQDEAIYLNKNRGVL